MMIKQIVAIVRANAYIMGSRAFIFLLICQLANGLAIASIGANRLIIMQVK
jgi:alanine racemase